MRLDVRLTGWRELDRALGELKQATARRILRREAQDALEPIAAAASAMAPRDEGRLAFSIVVSERGTRRADWKVRGDPSTFIMAVGPGSGIGVLPYASFVEFGTVDTPAQPYMRPAWEAHKGAALASLIQGLRTRITAAANRQARQSARASGA
ncbi:MAG: HK97-gp10 family putative phage morphogenesis protein [Sphingomonas sp.]